MGQTGSHSARSQQSDAVHDERDLRQVPPAHLEPKNGEKTGCALLCIASAMHRALKMKTTTIPPLRVSPELRRQAESVLEEGETLSGFVLDAVTRSIEYRNLRQEFIAHGLASAARASKSGRYVTAERVVAKLARRLAEAKQRIA